MALITQNSELRYSGPPNFYDPRRGKHVSGGREDTTGPGFNTDSNNDGVPNNVDQGITFRVGTDPSNQSLSGLRPSASNLKDSIFIGNDTGIGPEGGPIGFQDTATNQNFKFAEGIDPNNQSFGGTLPSIPNLKDSIFIGNDTGTGPDEGSIGSSQDTATNQNFKFAEGIDPNNQSLGGTQPLKPNLKDSIFTVNDFVEDPTDPNNIGTSRKEATNQDLKFAEGIDPGDQSLDKGRTPIRLPSYLKSSNFVIGNFFDDLTDPNNIGTSQGTATDQQGLKFNPKADPEFQSFFGTQPSFDKPSKNDSFFIKGINEGGRSGLEFEEGIDLTGQGTVKRRKYNSFSYQGRVRLEDLALVTTKGINPLESPRFITNEGLIAFSTALDASLKAKKDKLSTFGKAALKGGLDIAKTATGILASTPVAGTGVHLIFPPAVNNQYLQKEDPSFSNFLDTIAPFTGVTSGTGVNGASQAYITGSVQKGSIESNFVDSNDVKVKHSGLSKSGDTDPDRFFIKPSDIEGFNVQQNGESTATFAYEILSGSNYRLGEVKVNIPGQDGDSNKKVESIGLRTKLVSTGAPSGSSLDVIAVETIDIGRTSDIKAVDDIIPFNIEIYDPQKPEQYSLIKLRAYLDSFSDNYVGSWNGTKYIGRAEQLYNYTGFDRNISFGFKVAALSQAELIPLYTKLNTLVGTTAASYDDDEQNFMQGIFIKLTIGDYLKKVPGFFEKIDLSWKTDYPWELGLDTNNEKLPHVLDVSVGFKPIHDFNPKYGSNFIEPAIPEGVVTVGPLVNEGVVDAQSSTRNLTSQ